MDGGIELVAIMATWFARILFFVGFLPQILLNYKLKSVRGLSDLLIIGYLNGYIAAMYYAFCLYMPLSFRVMIPLAFFAPSLIVVQRFLYADYKDHKDKRALFLYSLDILFAASFIPIAMKSPVLVGYICGWLMAIFWGLYQLPQVVKVFCEKSVKGFSFSLISFVAIGNAVELGGALVLGLPMPTLLNDVRSLFIYLIFCLQFWIYRCNVDQTEECLKLPFVFQEPVDVFPTKNSSLSI